MDDDDEENQKYDKGKKYWIPGLKIIGKSFFIAFAVNSRAVFFREKSVTVSSVDELYCLLRNRCNILF